VTGLERARILHERPQARFSVSDDRAYHRQLEAIEAYRNGAHRDRDGVASGARFQITKKAGLVLRVQRKA
jgi:hypothetical protein